MVWNKLYYCICKQRKIFVLKALKGFCKLNSPDDFKISYLFLVNFKSLHKMIRIYIQVILLKKKS